MKCALYARISKEELNQPKYSIAAQLDRLEKYAKEHKYTIYDKYVDNGISAATIKKRESLVKLLDNLDNFDIVLFTQLDRFSRNVLDANTMVQTMEAHNVAFKAIDEDDIDTTTADGKFIFNLKVSLAERERQKTSERIKAVNQFKLNEKKAIFGVGPTGYKIDENKRWVLSEDAAMIKDMFDTYVTSGSRNCVRLMLQEKYGKVMDNGTISHLLAREAYTGRAYGMDDYYPRLISEDVWNETVRLRTKNKIRSRATGNVYIFRGLLTCKHCGHMMTGAYSKRSKDSPYRYYIYRCNRKSENTALKSYCTDIHQIREAYLEQLLIDNVKQMFGEFTNDEKKKLAQKKPIDINKINGKIERIQDLYVDGMISKEKFNADYAKLNDELNDAIKHNASITLPDHSATEAIIRSFKPEDYKNYTRLEKWNFWKSIIDHIVVDKHKQVEVIFK